VFNLNKKKLIPFVVIVSLLIFLSLSILILRRPALSIARPGLGLVTLLRNELGGIIFYHHNLSENAKLKKQAEFLRYKLNNLNEIYLENLRLNKLLFFKRQSPFKIIAARVISRPPDSWSTGLIIDKGALNGIRKGCPAITYLGLAGRVVETTNTTAKIMLLSAPDLGVSAIVQRSRQEGLVCGTLGGTLIMKYLPEDADIKLQDVIVTSGLNDTYPKGLLIGTVVDIGKEFSGLSRYCLIRPAVNLSNIEEVLIVIP